MRLNSLQLENFKNYSHLKLDLADVPLLILVGNNGQGKTNLLEAIVILALSKSFQGVQLRDMVNWYLHESDTGLPEFFQISGTLETIEGSTDLQVICGKTRKYPMTLKRDALKTAARDYVGKLRIVLFTPQDLNMILLAPQLRRRYVNILISQSDPEYLGRLTSYQYVLRQRNRLLAHVREGVSKPSELDFWDEQLVEHGSVILWKRRQIVSSLNENLSVHYASISSEEVDLKIQWKKSWTMTSFEELRDSFSEYLSDKRSRDIECGSTCGGPHREDFIFSLNGRNLTGFASRGECRSAVLALKLAELAYLRNLTGDSPLVLFDDVFSELDADRQKRLLQLFDADQVIITTTHLDHVYEDAVVWTVRNGRIDFMGIHD